jgi:VIT1/CCC1 family predicted Fe2+/Mn2+ transporter
MQGKHGREICIAAWSLAVIKGSADEISAVKRPSIRVERKEVSMKEQEKEKRARVLDPVSRISEIIFGVLMALSFTGSLNVATAGREEVRTMMLTALGCNLAWGLVDAVMYLVATMTERARNLTLLQRVRSAAEPRAAYASIAEALPGRMGEAIGVEGLEDMRRHLAALPDAPSRARLRGDDFLGAFGVFLLVVLSTFPVVIPFMFISEMAFAMRVSNAVALVMLFIGGYKLGRYAGASAWRTGLGMAAVGGVLVSIIMTLGG